MNNLGPMEIILILVVVLLLFGPKRLPELGKNLGKGIREFKKGTQGLKEELENSLSEPKEAQEPVIKEISTVVQEKDNARQS